MRRTISPTPRPTAPETTSPCCPCPSPSPTPQTVSLPSPPTTPSPRRPDAGDLDIATVPRLRTQALALIEQGRRHLILDLGDVTFCDSSGFNVLVGIFRCAKADDGTLVVAAVPDRLERLLDHTDLSALHSPIPPPPTPSSLHTRSQDTATA
ncbi:STAS domain-containing protein [Streptomyces sp. NPDC017991]|uniref:STAS domain-containing protein n=1 Tax=Streptomyces sp. NPDC017991 TaxID=3365026 RepID=UPI0037A65D39